jgi:mono/diheme cytochrome c family protein
MSDSSFRRSFRLRRAYGGQVGAQDFFASSMVVMFAAVFGATATPVIRAQEPARTVADGVYSDVQATRGAGAFDVACSGCHRADLTGNSGPALRGQRFASQYAGKDLRTLFTKIATTMPKNAAGSLAENVNLDIVAHLLRENGFPAGAAELAANALDGIRVLPGRPKPPPPVGDFSYVEVVGCLTAGPRQTWTLTRASEPVSVVPDSALRQSAAPSTAAAPTDAPPGTHTLHLVDAMAYAPNDHAGHTIYVRGLLIKVAGEPRMTISAFEMVSPTCR